MFASSSSTRASNSYAAKGRPRARPQPAAKTTRQTPREIRFGQAAAAKPAALEVPQLKFEKYIMENGSDVILSGGTIGFRSLRFNLWYHVGPANEVPGRTGFAHLFEHDDV